MKALTIFYTSCLLVLYSITTFIGYHHKAVRNLNGDFLPEIVITANKSKAEESNILAGHFNRAKSYLMAKKAKQAGKEVYDALMVFTIRTLSTGNYDKQLFTSVVNDLKDCCIRLEENKRVSAVRLNQVFERAELFVAETSIIRSEKEVKNNHLVKALGEINQAEESIVLAYKYANRKDQGLDKKIFNGSRHYLNDVLVEMNTNKFSSWQQMKRKLNTIDGRLEGSVTQ